MTWEARRSQSKRLIRQTVAVGSQPIGTPGMHCMIRFETATHDVRH